MLIVLDTTTRTLKAKMDMAASISNCSVIVAYADHDGTNFTEGVDPSTLNGTTAVTILSAPASATRRVVKSITVYNPDTDTHTTTLIFNDNGTEYGITRLTLPPGASWSSDDQTGVNVGGALTDGDKGDISVSGGGDTWTIDTNAVTLAKLAQISSGSFLGRSTAGTGNVEEIGSTGSGNVVRATSATLTTPSIAALANLTTNGFVRTSSGNGTLSVDTNTYLTSNQAITLSGDVTGTGTTGITATIANQAVTYAKIQNVSATSRILGRRTAGAGSVEEMTLSETLDLIGSAAQGDILYRGATGWARLGAGTNGQFLRTSGTGADPSWATIAAGLTVGTTTITSGTSGNVLYNNGGVLGEYTTVPVSEGGTGSSSLTANNVLLGNGTSALQVVAPGTSGNVLTSNGTTWTSAAPAGGGGSNSVCDGRLSVSSTLAVPTSDVTNATTLYYLPYTGNGIALYDGTSAWTVRTFSSSGISISLAGLTPNCTYDVFAYWTGSAVALELESWGINTAYNITTITRAAATVVNYSYTGSVPFPNVGIMLCMQGLTGTVGSDVLHNTWTNTQAAGTSSPASVTFDDLDTTGKTYTNNTGTIRENKNTRTTALTKQDGVYVKSGATTRRYLGTIRIDGAGGQTQDTDTQRLVWNYYNRVDRKLFRAATLNFWTVLVRSPLYTFVAAQNSQTSRVQLVCGIEEDLVKADATGCYQHDSSSGIFMLTGVGFDRSDENSTWFKGRQYLTTLQAVGGVQPCYGTYESTMLGFHYLHWVEYASAASTRSYGTSASADKLRQIGLGE